MAEKVVNPYKCSEGKGVSKVKSTMLHAKVSSMFYIPGTGLLFKLFDTGNLALPKERCYCYKNAVGDAARLFLKRLEAEHDFNDSFRKFIDELKKIAILSCETQEKANIFIEKFEEALADLREMQEVD